MADSRGSLGKTVVWGVVSAALYVGLFAYADEIIHLIHTTGDTCVVSRGTADVHYAHPNPAACVALGGELVPGNPLHVLVPILIALAISLAHGLFTGLFWNLIGLKAAPKESTHESH